MEQVAAKTKVEDPIGSYINLGRVRSKPPHNYLLTRSRSG